MTKLKRAIRDTMVQDPSIRQPAEFFIEKAKKLDGFCPAVLEIALDPTMTKEVNICASILLANKIRQKWAEDKARDMYE